MKVTPAVIYGRWRPVQGLIQAYAVVSGTRGLLAGPVPGEPLQVLTKDLSPTVALIFYVSLFVGGLTCMIGEIKQLTAPVVATKQQDIDRTVFGNLIERAGCILIFLNYGGFAIAIIMSDAIATTRSWFYIAIALGFLCRGIQITADLYRIKHPITIEIAGD